MGCVGFVSIIIESYRTIFNFYILFIIKIIPHILHRINIIMKYSWVMDLAWKFNPTQIPHKATRSYTEEKGNIRDNTGAA